MPTRPRRMVLTIMSVALIGFGGWLLWQQHRATVTVNYGVFGLTFFNAFAVWGSVLAGMRSRGPQRVAWLCLAVGIAGMIAGDMTSACVRLITHAPLPIPSPVDALYLLLPVGVMAATVFAPLQGVRTAIRQIADGVIVSASLFIVAWSVGLQGVYEATDHRASLAFAVGLAFPIADLALFTIVVVFAIKAPAAARRGLILLASGLFVVAITNCAIIFWRIFPPHDDGRIVMGWAVGSFLMGAGALWSDPARPPDAGPPRPPTRTSLLLPLLPVPFAVVLGIVDLWPLGGTAPIFVGGLILAVAALIRQFTLLDENFHLRATVADIELRDPLTGLGNRTLFADRLAHAMQLRLRKDAPVAVLLLDLDDFKLVNDSLGHSAGDRLLRSVGERIQSSLRTGDTIARLGGDEFAILIEDHPDAAYVVAESVVAAFDNPFVVDGREVFVRPGVGIATSVSAGDADLTADDLFRQADLAMYSAKRDHFRGVRAFTPGMRLDATELHLTSGLTVDGQGDAVGRIQLLGDLRRAIDDDELQLVYQPKFSLSTGSVVGVEALLRWPHPTLGVLAPADFLPLVRQNGLMEAVNELVVSRAVQEAAGWYAAGVRLPVAINLSAPSLDDQTLPDRLLSVLAAHGMPADSLSVEITEDQLLASLSRTRKVLERLRQNGIRVAIDDFGSGYAAMTYLRELPIDELKLDRQFVAPILHDPRAAAIVETMIELADTFGIACVAEGVEDKATADRLREYGCGYVQGHYFSRPVPAQAVRLGLWGAPPADDRLKQTATTRPSSA